MRIRALAVAPLLLLLVVLAGCSPGGASRPLADQPPPSNGESGKTGPEVAKDAAQELLADGAASVEGHLTVDGQDESVDLHLQGSDMSGTVLTSGQAIQIAVAHGVAYAMGPVSFWTSVGMSDPVARRLAGRWVRDAGTAVEGLTPVTLIWLADEVRSPSKASIEQKVHLAVAQDAGKLTGTPVVVVPLSGPGSIQVTAVGKPRPLVLDHPGGLPGRLTLSAFGESAPVVAPSSSVDLASVL